MSRATDILRKYSDYSDIAIDDALSAMREAMEEAFKAGIILTLSSIAKTFHDNMNRGDNIRDVEVFRAISETIVKFPHPSNELFINDFFKD
jgi:chaperonin GroEL (HSP60 family)